VVQVPDLEPLKGELRWFAGRVREYASD